MAQAGMKILFSSTQMAVVGLTEAFYKIYTILKASFTLKALLKRKRPDLLILIDYPEFNINLANTAKNLGIPVLYYISPQIWAWRKGRVKKIGQRVDRMAVILPFEEEFFKKKNIETSYVGHPLLDAYPADIEYRIDSSEDKLASPVLGLLPGSRREEIRNLLPDMVEAVKILQKSYPHLTCILPMAPTIKEEYIKSFLNDSTPEITLVRGNMHEILKNCNLALVTSGTATLDLAIMGVPMVIIYRLSRLSYWLCKLLIKVPYIGLVNLVAGRKVVPELIQDEVTPETLADHAHQILEHHDIRKKMILDLEEVRRKLGRGGASNRVAHIALEIMGEK